jgi:Chromo (CHRromatin Organisation MOdifier) domain
MSTVNKSTGFSPFQLRLGRQPRLIPPLIATSLPEDATDRSATAFMQKIHLDTLEAKDNLTRAKLSQAVQSNRTRTLSFPFKIRDRVRLSTFHRRHEFKSSGERRVAKFMPRFDGPFKILATNESASTVKLDLPPGTKVHPIFHTSQILPYFENDLVLFPNREFAKPLPIANDQGEAEYLIRDIIDERRSGRGYKYLVRWIGYGEEENRWLPRKELEDTEALDISLAGKVLDPTFTK